MKKYILTLFVFAIATPMIAYASWWNPFTWFNTGVPVVQVSQPPKTNVTPFRITSLSPKSGQIGTMVTINGSNFAADGTSVYLDSYKIGVTNKAINNPDVRFVNIGKLIFEVPSMFVGGCEVAVAGNPCDQIATPVKPGTYSLTVRNRNGSSNKISFMVTKTTKSVPPITVTPPDSRSDAQPTPPFCAQPPMPTCPVGVSCIQAFPQPRTYTNYGDFVRDGATYLYAGVCITTVDAPGIVY